MNPDNPSSTIDEAGASAESGFAATKSHALQAAEELRAAAGAKAQELKEAAESRAKQIRDVAGERAGTLKDVAGAHAGQIKDVAGNTVEDALERANEVREELEAYVRAHPTRSILTTFGVGVFIGLLLRR